MVQAAVSGQIIVPLFSYCLKFRAKVIKKFLFSKEKYLFFSFLSVNTCYLFSCRTYLTGSPSRFSTSEKSCGRMVTGPSMNSGML